MHEIKADLATCQGMICILQSMPEPMATGEVMAGMLEQLIHLLEGT